MRYKQILSYENQSEARFVCKSIGEDADMFLAENGEMYEVVFFTDAPIDHRQRADLILDYHPDGIQVNVWVEEEE